MSEPIAMTSADGSPVFLDLQGKLAGRFRENRAAADEIAGCPLGGRQRIARLGKLAPDHALLIP